MSLLGILRSIGQWLLTPISDKELTPYDEIFPTPAYHAWITAGRPQEPGFDLTWDGKKDDNPRYDRRLAYARAKLRELLIEEKKRKKEQAAAWKQANQQAKELKRVLDLGPGIYKV